MEAFFLHIHMVEVPTFFSTVTGGWGWLYVFPDGTTRAFDTLFQVGYVPVLHLPQRGLEYADVSPMPQLLSLDLSDNNITKVTWQVIWIIVLIWRIFKACENFHILR